jgi:hypothetical protein
MVWYHYFRNKVSFRIYGEGLYLAGLQTTTPGLSMLNPDPSDPNSAVPGILGTATQANVETPASLTPPFPTTGYPTQVPFGPTHDSDEIRADDFANSMTLMNAANMMPQFLFLLLPNDHTNGSDASSLTPGSFMAVNDHALGRILESLGKTQFWDTSAVFVVEDDTQGGRDSVDANRVLSLTAGPFVKHGYVSHVHHSIYSILKTTDLILGVPPESVQEATATSMADYFTDTPGNTPYTAKKYEVDPTLKNSALAATGDRNFQVAADLQEHVPSGSVDFGPITGRIEQLVYQSERATGVAYMPPLDKIQEHTLTHAVPAAVPASAFSCGSGGNGSSPFPTVGASIGSLPSTAVRNPIATLAVLAGGLLLVAGPWMLRRALRRRGDQDR